LLNHAKSAGSAARKDDDGQTVRLPDHHLSAAVRTLACQHDTDRSARHHHAGAAIRGFVTAEDSKSEEDAVIAANRAIRELDS
jgi:hypothetical protein